MQSGTEIWYEEYEYFQYFTLTVSTLLLEYRREGLRKPIQVHS